MLHALAAHGQRNSRSITVLLRPCAANNDATLKREAQLADLARSEISHVEADIVNDTEFVLESVYDQYHTVIGCTGMTYPPGTQLEIGRAVLASKARRYFPWQFGVDYDVIGRGSPQDLFSEQLDVRDLPFRASIWVCQR